MAWNRHERTALADALAAAGPGRPTLCAGWRTEHLAAHVVLRETSPLAAAGIGAPPLAARTERVTQAVGDRHAAPADYARLVERVRSGPPVWSPVGWLGDAGNLLELLVHTEDVRRGDPGRPSPGPRPLPPGLEEAVWRWTVRSAGLFYRGAGVDVVLTDGSHRHRVRARRRRDGASVTSTPVVVVRGAVTELALHAFDRARVARVELEGDPSAVGALDVLRPRG